MKLESVTAGRNNNLNLIRFIAAILVIYSHSYPIGTGTDAGEPLMRVSGGQIGFGSKRDPDLPAVDLRGSVFGVSFGTVLYEPVAR